jgi:hypothetical protein
MLNTCSPGVAVVNIDNGLGAAAMAYKVVCPTIVTRIIGLHRVRKIHSLSANSDTLTSLPTK